ESLVSAFTFNTLEQVAIQKRLLELGVTVATSKTVTGLLGDGVELACVFTGRAERIAAKSAVLVTMQSPDDALYHDLASDPDALPTAGIRKLVRLGDCFAPGTIAAAVYSGHRFARDLDVIADAIPYRRENVELGPL